MSELKSSPPLRKPANSVKHGAASVSWGPRMYGPDTIVANAPIDAITDLMRDDKLNRPALHPVQRDDGSTGWMYVHHSLDGRESTE